MGISFVEITNHESFPGNL